MATGDIVSLGNLVVRIAGQVQVLGENCYRASKDWEAFPDKVQNLRLLYHVWKDEFEKFGMLSDPILMTPLEQAKVLLEKEEARLKSRGAGCGSILRMTAFPGTIGQRVQRVIDAFDNIPKMLQLKEAARAAVEKAWVQRPRPLAFRDDDHYVSLEDSESAVYSALAEKHLHGPKVVLLHGGPGKGKSTVARHVAILYENFRKQAKGEDKRVQFQQVIYLECGQKATALLKQVELLQWLGMEDAALQDDQQTEALLKQVELLQWLGMEDAAVQDDQQTDLDLRIQEKLRSALSSQKILIIFDDVWERRFLGQMLNLCGDGVKCLVTSQDRNLCWGLQCSPSVIRIQDVTPEVGRKMLASYVFPNGNQQLPRQVLVILEYVFNDRLHNEGISNLLTSKMSTLPMLNALDRVATIKKEPLLTKETGGIMESLVGLLRNWEQRESIENTVTAITLRSLSFNPEHKGYIISSGCLEEVVNILSADSPENLQVALTRMLVALSHWERRHASRDDLRLRMFRTQGLFDLLSSYSSKEAIPVLQENAALTLGNLAALHAAEQLRDPRGVGRDNPPIVTVYVGPPFSGPEVLTLPEPHSRFSRFLYTFSRWWL